LNLKIQQFIQSFKKHYLKLCKFITLLCALVLGFSGKSIAQTVSSDHVSLSDTTRFGALNIFYYKGWQFSFAKPEQIKDTINLRNTQSIPSLYDFSIHKASPEWKKYGWFELKLVVDSTIAGKPFFARYMSLEPIKLWLNGNLILEAGKPSVNEEDEVLSRYGNPKVVGVILREGANYFLVEYSSHKLRPIHNARMIYENGIDIQLFKWQEPIQRRERAFIFGGTLLLLINLILIHLFLAYKFKGSYHAYVAFTTFFLLLHAFGTLSDTLFEWTNDYMYFYVISYVLAYLFVLYFFIISIRKFYELPIKWGLMTVILMISVLIGLYISFYKFDLVAFLHVPVILLSLVYGVYSLYEAKKANPKNSITIISLGLGITILGVFLYAGVYLIISRPMDFLLYLATLLSYTGIPISLTLNVATSYAKLISTLEEKIKDRTAKLELSNEFQKRFFANVSHEFRTPLTISEGLLNKTLQSESNLNEHSRDDLWLAKRNLVRLHDMVDQVIELTKADHQELKLHKKHIRASQLASICVESFRSLAEYRGHTFTFTPNTEPVFIHVDPSNAEIMVNNLISNAIKFTPDGGFIEIKTQVHNQDFVLTVADSGPGIPEDKREAIFERFHRITQEDGEYVEGMGVGLELSRTLARLHDGDISVYANNGKGSVFGLRLPVSQQEITVVTELENDNFDEVLDLQTRVQTEVDNHDYTVLLVEDNDDLMHYVSSILEPLGSIEKAKNGLEALEKLETITPDIIITDLMMPKMNGVQFIEKLIKNKVWKDIPVIVLTAKALETEKTNLLRIGVVDYVTKPFSAEQLVLKAKNLLSYYQTRKTVKLEINEETVQAPESFVTNLAAFITENIKDSNLSVDSMATVFAMSRSSFYRNLEMESGMTPAEFIREVRMTSARGIVAKNKTIRLEELANAVGYKSVASFRKVYQDRFGEHPINGSK